MTETPKTTETSNLPYDFEFGDLTDDDVPDSDGQGSLLRRFPFRAHLPA